MALAALSILTPEPKMAACPGYQGKS